MVLLLFFFITIMNKQLIEMQLCLTILCKTFSITQLRFTKIDHNDNWIDRNDKWEKSKRIQTIIWIKSFSFDSLNLPEFYELLRYVERICFDWFSKDNLVSGSIPITYNGMEMLRQNGLYIFAEYQSNIEKLASLVELKKLILLKTKNKEKAKSYIDDAAFLFTHVNNYLDKYY